MRCLKISLGWKLDPKFDAPIHSHINFNIMMKIITGLGALLFSAAVGNTATIQVDYSAAPGERDVRLVTTNAPIPSGNKVAIGTFDLTGGFDVAANAGSISALASRWIEFDSKSTRSLGGEAGRFSESGLGDDAGLVGEPIYLWIFKTQTNSDPQIDFSDPVALNAPGADFSDILGYGLYNAPSWNFPDGSSPPPSNLIAITSDDSGIVALHPTSVDGVVGPDTTGSLMLVPEPSTAAFFGLSLLLLAYRRNR